MIYTKTPIHVGSVWRDGIIAASDTPQSFSGEITLPGGDRYLVELHDHKRDGGKHYYWFLILRQPDNYDEQIKLLEARVKAQTDRGDFMEECFADLAMMVL